MINLKSTVFFLNAATLLTPNLINANETRIKIAVIDTGVSRSVAQMSYMCENGVKNFTIDNTYDTNGHGSHIVNIIGSRIDSKKYCIVSYKVFYDKDYSSIDTSLNALSSVYRDKNIKYVNISMNGNLQDIREFSLIEKITSRGTKFTVAAGNESKKLSYNNCDQFPSCYKLKLSNKHNFNVVGALNADFSNYGPVVDVVVDGTVESLGVVKRGTSQASAMYASTLINSK